MVVPRNIPTGELQACEQTGRHARARSQKALPFGTALVVIWHRALTPAERHQLLVEIERVDGEAGTIPRLLVPMHRGSRRRPAPVGRVVLRPTARDDRWALARRSTRSDPLGVEANKRVMAAPTGVGAA